MVFLEFFSWIIDEISFDEYGIKPIEALTYILFLVLTLLVILNISYLSIFIDFGIQIIISAIFVTFFMKMRNNLSD